MKRILIALFCLPLISTAQSDISVNGGILCNVPLQEKYKNVYTTGFGMNISVKYQRYAKHHLMYGAAFGVYNIQYKYKGSYTDYISGKTTSWNSRVLFSEPGFGLDLFAGNHFQMKHSTINAGLSLTGMYNHIPSNIRQG